MYLSILSFTTTASPETYTLSLHDALPISDAGRVDMGFSSRRSLVIWGDQLIRRGPLRPLKRLLLHSPLVVWAPFASNVYHDWLWYPTVGRARIRAFDATPWGRLFASY